MTLVGLLCGCAASPAIPTSWVLNDHRGNVVYMTWTAHNGNIAGTTSEASALSSAAAARGPATTDSTVAVSGNYSGGKITVRLGGTFLGATLTGTVSPRALEFETSTTSGGIPLGAILRPGSIGAYNADVRSLSSRVQSARARAVVSEGTARYDQLIQTTIPADVSQLKTEESALAAALQGVQNDYSSLFTNADAATCSGSKATSDADAAYQALQTDAYTETGEANDVLRGKNTILNDLSGLNGLPESLDTPAVNDMTLQASKLAQAATQIAASSQATAGTLDSKSQNIGGAVASLPPC